MWNGEYHIVDVGLSLAWWKRFIRGTNLSSVYSVVSDEHASCRAQTLFLVPRVAITWLAATEKLNQSGIVLPALHLTVPTEASVQMRGWKWKTLLTWSGRYVNFYMCGLLSGGCNVRPRIRVLAKEDSPYPTIDGCNRSEPPACYSSPCCKHFMYKLGQQRRGSEIVIHSLSSRGENSSFYVSRYDTI